MDDRTLLLLEKLAEKFGTTTEHLWKALIKEANIEGTFYSILNFLILAIVAFVFKSMWKYAGDSLSKDDVMWVRTGITFLCSLFVVVLVVNIIGYISTLLNPEYWALMQIVGKIK